MRTEHNTMFVASTFSAYNNYAAASATRTTRNHKGATSTAYSHKTTKTHTKGNTKQQRQQQQTTGDILGVRGHRRGAPHRRPHGHGHPGPAVPDVPAAAGDLAAPRDLLPHPGRLRPDRAGARVERPGVGDHGYLRQGE